MTIKMAGEAGCVICFLFIFVGASLSDKPPAWPDVYEVQGTLKLPYAEIVEPFYAYYDSKANKSRIDYYGDLVQTAQIAGKGDDYGKNFKVAPMTNESVLNQRTCFLVNGTKNATVTIQSVLPDLTGFQKGAPATINGIDCDTWEKVEMHGKKKNTYTMWVEQKTQRPLKYIMIGFDSLLGSHYDKYYIDYSNFTTASIPDVKFNITTNLKCGGFPGPGAEHRVMMNPMQEYIQQYDDHINEMFHHFKRRHSKSYKNEAEHQRRAHIFRQNVRYIHSKNRAGLGYRLAVNHMADMESQEMKMMHGLRHTPGYNGGLPFNKNKYNLKDIPDQLDWRLYGAVSQVKDQAVCGSCWSFGTTGTLEGAYFLKTGQLVRLSQQELMDCSWGEGNNACDGGEDFRAYRWVMKHGIATEEEYGPYLGQDGYCNAANKTITARVKDYVNVTSGDLQALKVAIAKQGPISVGIDASHKSLSFYANGVYYEPKCGNTPDDLDHAVLAVGYGVMNGQAYWLIKNSWSTYWGNNGYVLMAQKDNNCGTATAASFVLM